MAFPRKSEQIVRMRDLQEMLAAAGDWADHLFARGYVISDHEPVRPPGWLETRLDQFLIASHPALEVRSAQSGNAALVCLGILFDAMRPNRESQDCLQDLAERLAWSEDAMLSALAGCNGRFVILYRRGDDGHHVVGDATGLRTALYHFGEAGTVASHINLLVAGAASHEPRDARQFKFGFPGRLTPVRNVFVLTPNTKLDLKRRQVSRFWPTHPVAERSLDEAATQIAERLTNSYAWIAARYDHFLTLTAGLDSRVTLSIAKTAGRYATYYRRDTVDTDPIDRDTSLAMAQAFSLDHQLLLPETRTNIPEDYRTVVRLNTYKPHIPDMTFAYRNLLLKEPGRGVHIRSNLSEIGRMFYQGRNGGRAPETPVDLVTLWSTRPELRGNPENVAAFADFAEATGFFKAPVELSSLLYWEHRMGAWHSQVALESDIACESLSLYNCRDLLQTMWSVPTEFQKRSLVLKRIIYRQWPQLADFPVNGDPFRPANPSHAALVMAEVH